MRPRVVSGLCRTVAKRHDDGRSNIVVVGEADFHFIDSCLAGQRGGMAGQRQVAPTFGTSPYLDRPPIGLMPGGTQDLDCCFFGCEARRQTRSGHGRCTGTRRYFMLGEHTSQIAVSESSDALCNLVDRGHVRTDANYRSSAHQRNIRHSAHSLLASGSAVSLCIIDLHNRAPNARHRQRNGGVVRKEAPLAVPTKLLPIRNAPKSWGIPSLNRRGSAGVQAVSLRRSPHLVSLAAALGNASVAWCSPIWLHRLVTALPRV